MTTGSAHLAIRTMCRPSLLNALFIAVGLSGSALVAFQKAWPSLLGSLCLLGWTAGEGLKILWEEFKQDPEEAITMSKFSSLRALD